MLRILRHGQRWIVIALVLTVGAVFILAFGTGTSRQKAPPDTVVMVGDESFSVRHVGRIRSNIEERYREQMQGDFNSKDFRDMLDQTAIQTTIQQAIISQEGARLGLRVSDEEVKDAIRSYFASGDESFPIERYRSYAQRNFGSEHNFEESVRRELLRFKIMRVWNSAATVSTAEARDAVLFEQERVQFAFVTFDEGTGAEQLEISEQQITAYLGEQEEAVRKLYDDRSRQYNKPERARARHILFRFSTENHDEESAKLKADADAARQRLLAGEDFATLAQELSMDPGSKSQGGDLGFFVREQMVPEFSDAAFSLEIGEVSEPVKTNFGYHLIRVDEKQAASVQLFEEVRADLAREMLKQELVKANLDTQAEELLGQLGARTLVKVAQEQGINIERTGLLSRSSGDYVPNLGTASEVIAAAFALTLEEPSPKRVFHVEGRPVLIQLINREEPGQIDLIALTVEKRNQLRATRQQELFTAWINMRRNQLSEAHQLSTFPEVLSGGS